MAHETVYANEFIAEELPDYIVNWLYTVLEKHIQTGNCTELDCIFEVLTSEKKKRCI